MAQRAARNRTHNVLMDLELPGADEPTAKVVLAKKINDILERRALTPSAAAALLGIPQPKISAIRHYKTRGISLELLMQALNRAWTERGNRRHALAEEVGRADCRQRLTDSSVDHDSGSVASFRVRANLKSR